MSDILALIKKAAVDAVNQSKPVEITFGTVVSVAPLEIRRDQKLTLKEAVIIKAAKAMENISDGDTVALLRVRGGQKYLLIDKVV